MMKDKDGNVMTVLTKLYNITTESERMPEKWRDSVLIPIFENKGESQSCIIGYSRDIDQ